MCQSTKEKCEKILANGKQCLFPRQKDSSFCKRHCEKTKFVDAEINTIQCMTNTISTNTSSVYNDELKIAEDTIVNLLNEISSRDEYIKQIERDYDVLKNRVIQNFLNST